MTYAIFVFGFVVGVFFRSCRVKQIPSTVGPYLTIWFGFRNTGLVWQGVSKALYLQYVDRSVYTVDVFGRQETRRRNLVTGVQLLGQRPRPWRVQQ